MVRRFQKTANTLGEMEVKMSFHVSRRESGTGTKPANTTFSWKTDRAGLEPVPFSRLLFSLSNNVQLTNLLLRRCNHRILVPNHTQVLGLFASQHIQVAILVHVNKFQAIELGTRFAADFMILPTPKIRRIT